MSLPGFRIIYNIYCTRFKHTAQGKLNLKGYYAGDKEDNC